MTKNLLQGPRYLLLLWKSALLQPSYLLLVSVQNSRNMAADIETVTKIIPLERKRDHGASFGQLADCLPRKERRCLSLKRIIHRNTKLLGKWLGETLYPLQPESWVQVTETTSLLTEVRLCTSKSPRPSNDGSLLHEVAYFLLKISGNELHFGLTLGWVGFKKSKHLPSASPPLFNQRKS